MSTLQEEVRVFVKSIAWTYEQHDKIDKVVQIVGDDDGPPVLCRQSQ